MTSQSSPAEVKVKCYYTVKLGEFNPPSPHSDTSSIIIHTGGKPQMSVQHFHGDHVLFTCYLPGSANHDTRCNLYFGETNDPVVTTTVWKQRSSTNQWFCQFTVTIDHLLNRIRLVKQRKASCDYSLGSEPKALSPHSDGYSLTDILEIESGATQRTPTFTVTTELTSTTAVHVETTSVTGLTLTAAGSLTSADTTLISPASEDEITEKMVSMIGAGVTVGVVFLVLALLFAQSRTETCVSKSFFTSNPNFTGKSKDDRNYMVDYDETYSTVTYEW
ncbi:uncharacterized protein LOC121613678 isoform X2 [Chelmon rostratus]|nr:uncharacterized protein LOC121613678 isoform X2 [Chelmon rostratus]XP_041803197.1 uncharacterized protein LOC121613678 isoform X2 [Chelmon rostratus]